ncbi:transposase, partial [Streptococcus agalactiae]|uniref:transposase n=1 Tax=Streptococcus agalactiae TaxID=1311 RepID=UPI0030EB748A
MTRFSVYLFDISPLYQTGKTQSELCKDYGVSTSALAKWIKQYSQVKLEDNSVLTA